MNDLSPAGLARSAMIPALGALLKDRAPVLATVSGSALYGTATDSSDDDIRAVFLPSVREILLGHVSFGLDSNKANARLGAGDVDVSAVSLVRYLALLGKMDMISTEILFASRNPAMRVGPLSRAAEVVWEARDMLIAGNSGSAIGHARQRLGAFFPTDDASLDAFYAVHAILTELMARGVARIKDDPEALARIADAPNVEVVVSAQDRFTRDRPWAEMTQAEKDAGVSPHGPVYVVIAGKKIGTTNPLSEAIHVLERPLTRAAEQKRVRTRGEGIVWKDAYQAIRLLHQAIELHETRELIFPRSEAPLLRRIREGDSSAEELTEMITQLMDRVRAAEAAYPFRKQQCQETFEAVVTEMHKIAILGV